MAKYRTNYTKPLLLALLLVVVMLLNPNLTILYSLVNN